MARRPVREHLASTGIQNNHAVVHGLHEGGTYLRHQVQQALTQHQPGQQTPAEPDRNGHQIEPGPWPEFEDRDEVGDPGHANHDEDHGRGMPEVVRHRLERPDEQHRRHHVQQVVLAHE